MFGAISDCSDRGKGTPLTLTSRSERVTLPVLIAGELRSQIETDLLQPGDKLPGHRDLALSYGVSLGSVREAISILTGDGLVETRHGRGTFVAEASRLPLRSLVPVTREEIEELIEARELLGLSIVAMASERASPDQIARLRRAIDRMQAAAADADLYPEADVAFHLSLAEATGNRFLVRIMEDIRELLRRDIELSAGAGIRRFGDLQYSVDSHSELVDAIEAGDPDAARSVLLDIMSRHHEFVIGLYALAPPMPPDEEVH